MAAASSGCLFLSKNDPAATWRTLGNNSGEESNMTSKKRYLRIALAAAFSAAFAASSIAADVDGNRVLNADKELEKGNWITYHGSYKSWHYSPLDQINTKTVGKLTEAWSHTASRANRGLQGFPLAIDGVLYYSSPYNQVYALDGATGQVLGTYK